MPWKTEKEFVVMLGGDVFVDSPNLITYESEPLLTLERNEESGYLGVTFRVFDETGQKVATVGRNSLYPNKKYRGSKRLELQGGVHDWSLIESSSGSLICGLKQKEEAKPVELAVTASLYLPNGMLFSASPLQIIAPPSITLSNNLFRNAGIHLRKNGSLSIG